MTSGLVPFRIEPEWQERLESLAESKNLSRSRAVRNAVVEWVKKNYSEKEVILEAQRGLLVRVGYKMNPDGTPEFLSAEIIK